MVWQKFLLREGNERERLYNLHISQNNCFQAGLSWLDSGPQTYYFNFFCDQRLPEPMQNMQYLEDLSGKASKRQRWIEHRGNKKSFQIYGASIFF